MAASDVEKIRDELERLMREQIDSLTKQAFLGIKEEDLEHETERLKRIREVSADFLAALKKFSSWVRDDGIKGIYFDVFVVCGVK